MKKLALAALALTLAGPVAAQEQDTLAGRWLAVGRTTETNAQFTSALWFDDNGRVQMRMLIAPSGQYVGVDAMCQGEYRFNGQLLMTRMAHCQSCTGGSCQPAPTGMFDAQGPIEVQNQGTFTWVGMTYRRQQ